MKVDAIEIRYVDGTSTLVRPDRTIGDYAVHNAFLNSRQITTRWTVTHIPTGASVWMVLAMEDAVRVAQYLHESQIIPQAPDEARAWVKAEVHVEPLRKRLTEIAPYFPLPT